MGRLLHIILLGMVLSLWVTPIQAQLGPHLGGGLGNGLGNGLDLPLRQLPGDVLPDALDSLDSDTDRLSQDVRQTSESVSRDLVGRPLQAKMLDRDPSGAAIVKDRILAVSPNAHSLAIAGQLHFAVLAQDKFAALGLVGVTLQVPDGMTEVAALTVLRAADPNGAYDYDHVYQPEGDSVAASAGANAAREIAKKIRLGMIDGGIEKQHPSLANQTIVTRSFAGAGDPPATQHGTAIASLLIGGDGSFSGYLPGATLYAADVYGGAADGGSAADIAGALNWLAGNRIPVTNISLAGPDDALLAAAVKAFVTQGYVLVAAVGNDGPAAPPNYPAAYPGVVGVTSVDAALHLEIDANRNAARFAARGVDVTAAQLPNGYAGVTGTSYAAPVVTAQIALLVDRPDARLVQMSLDRISHATLPLSNTGPLLIAAPKAMSSTTR